MNLCLLHRLDPGGHRNNSGLDISGSCMYTFGICRLVYCASALVGKGAVPVSGSLGHPQQVAEVHFGVCG